VANPSKLQNLKGAHVVAALEVPCYIPSERILKEGGYEAGWGSDQGPGVPGATSNSARVWS